MDLTGDHKRAIARIPLGLRRRTPRWLIDRIDHLFWVWCDTRDFLAEAIGWLPSHMLRLLLYRKVLGMSIGTDAGIHRRCRFYRPAGVVIGRNTVINREVLLDGRAGLEIGDNVSISEGTSVFTLDHDPDSPVFAEEGRSVAIGDYVFLGSRVLVLPGVKIGKGAVVGAGAVVTRDVAPFDIVAGVPARSIGQRRRDLNYTLKHRKFLG